MHNAKSVLLLGINIFIGLRNVRIGHFQGFIGHFKAFIGQKIMFALRTNKIVQEFFYMPDKKKGLPFCLGITTQYIEELAIFGDLYNRIIGTFCPI